MWSSSQFNKSWKIVSREKQAKREELIREGTKDLTVTEKELLDKFSPLFATAKKITEQIKRGEWTAVQVVDTFILRASQTHRATNCLTEVLFAQARREAAILDAEFKETGKLRGPLHGVPMTVKDMVDVAGYDSTIGFTSYVDRPAASDAHIVKLLRASGAVLIAKTNVPQTMLGFECNNFLWGRTLNPWNAKYTCGGSSGGEATMLAMSASVLGIGSDAGGSLRIPAGYCGVYSLKPSDRRISKIGLTSEAPGREGYMMSAGPMARSIDDIELASRLCMGMPGYSGEPIAPAHYRDVTLKSRLKFGYYTSDGIIKASPACKRAVLETVEALRRAGHECVEIQTSLIRSILVDAFSIFVGYSSADNYEALLRPLGSDPMDASMWLIINTARIPYFIRKIAAWAIKYFKDDPLYADALLHSRPKSVSELYKTNIWRDECCKRWYKEIWDRFDFDGIICPSQAVPALPHKSTKTLSPLCVSTAVFNVIDSPIGAVPVTRVDPTLDALTPEWTSLSAEDSGSKILEEELYCGRSRVYDSEAMSGLPVGIQIMGKLWEDEKVIAMMRVIDKALGPRGFGPSALVN